jgi:hypothetical protein
MNESFQEPKREKQLGPDPVVARLGVPARRRRRDRLQLATGIATKLAIGFALAAAPIVASRIEQRISGTTLLAQREQSESALRAKMLGDLIVPITGGSDSSGLNPARERLLVELLALNFHEHFEFKPLLLHVDARLASSECPGLTTAQAIEGRYALRSIARRVANRQIATLESEIPPTRGVSLASLLSLPWLPPLPRMEPPAAGAHFVSFQGAMSPEDSLSRVSRGELFGKFGQPVRIPSPDGADLMTLILHRPDWQEDTVRVDLTVEARRHHAPVRQASFVLTWFDFPMTDNTRLRSGNRFAIVLNEVRCDPSPETSEIILQVIWFPKGYVTPAERPVNYKRLQELVG